MNGWLPLSPTLVLGPADLAAYLRQAGWLLATRDDRWASYTKDIDGHTITLQVPQRAAAPDYPRVVATLVDDLARLEDRDPAALVRDVRSSSLDVVRLRIVSPGTHDGRISVESGRRTFQAARDLLLAAACATVSPRAVYTSRRPQLANDLIERARFGQPEMGSYVLTIETAVAPRLQLTTVDDGDPDAPFERKVNVMLAQALSMALSAARAAGASGSIDPFVEATKNGVSANLCDAVSELFEATRAETVEASFAFASSRPAAASVPRYVPFSADTALLLRGAAAELRERAAYPDSEVEGTIVGVESADPAGGGVAVLRAIVEGTSRRVRVPLVGAAYDRAIVAHRAFGLVRYGGVLAREGRAWVLLGASELAVPAGAEER